MSAPVAALLGVLSLAIGSRAMADTTLNLLLIPGATFSVGELTFSDFAYNPAGPDIPAANDVTVSGFTRPGAAGLLFSGQWQDTTANGAAQNAKISYTVTTTRRLIGGAELFTFPMGVIPDGNNKEGFASVDESLLIVLMNQPILHSFSFVDDQGKTGVQLGQKLFFPPRIQVDTATSINLDNEGGKPFVGGVEESFFLLPDSGAGQEILAFAALAAAFLAVKDQAFACARAWF